MKHNFLILMQNPIAFDTYCNIYLVFGYPFSVGNSSQHPIKICTKLLGSCIRIIMKEWPNLIYKNPIQLSCPCRLAPLSNSRDGLCKYHGKIVNGKNASRAACHDLRPHDSIADVRTCGRRPAGPHPQSCTQPHPPPSTRAR